MLEEVKEKLLKQPEAIVSILETFGFSKITVRNREIRCAFEEGMNPTAVVIRLQNNSNLFVKDYERNLSYDLINYIIKTKNFEFKLVINAIKKELGIDNLYTYKKKFGLFGGIYNNLSKQNGEIEVQTYPEEVLKQYGNIPCERFLKDSISLDTQIKWGIGYDIISQRITIPIRTATGEIMGIKGRANFELDEFTPKYLYLINCPMSATLFGYYENYNQLYQNDVIVVESEKSVLKLDSWGYRNVVALGSNSLSATQAKLIMSLNPKSVIFMFDKSLELSNTKRDIDILKTFCTMRQIEIKYWDWTENITLNAKDAPCDDTFEEFEYILHNEIKDEKELETEEKSDGFYNYNNQ